MGREHIICIWCQLQKTNISKASHHEKFQQYSRTSSTISMYSLLLIFLLTKPLVSFIKVTEHINVDLVDS